MVGQSVELTQELSSEGSVFFDPEKELLEGFYGDELSAYRAKKGWLKTLQGTFLLDTDSDFNVQIRKENDHLRWVLRCEFHSACARYAFWRLTNSQALEAQYLIETAHLSDGKFQALEKNAATDLRNIWSEPLILSWGNHPRMSLRERFKRLLETIGRKIAALQKPS